MGLGREGAGRKEGRNQLWPAERCGQMAGAHGRTHDSSSRKYSVSFKGPILSWNQSNVCYEWNSITTIAASKADTNFVLSFKNQYDEDSLGSDLARGRSKPRMGDWHRGPAVFTAPAAAGRNRKAGNRGACGPERQTPARPRAHPRTLHVFPRSPRLSALLCSLPGRWAAGVGTPCSPLLLGWWRLYADSALCHDSER